MVCPLYFQREREDQREFLGEQEMIPGLPPSRAIPALGAAASGTAGSDEKTD